MIAPAKTGRERRSRIAVIKTDHTNNGILSIPNPKGRMFKIVEIKLIAPRIEDTPARCSEKIPISTAAPLCALLPDKGGYTVHPVPTPPSTKLLIKRRKSEGGRSQKLMLFIRGKAISGAPTIKGTSQFPKPPIISGITIKKIITNACAVTVTL